MYVALDSNGKRIYADDPVRYKECFCQCCGDQLKHKKGNLRQFFSHMPDTNCAYGTDSDNKSEWHIRMQNYFSKEYQEVRFVDGKSDDVYIADVFDPENNIVLEFQKSSIEPEEFWKRTIFHTSNGRRIVWVFDESRKDKNDNYVLFGRLRKNEYSPEEWPYDELTYKWFRNPRKFLAKFPPTNKPINLIRNSNILSICMFLGEKKDIVHRVVNQHHGFKDIVLSIHNIFMREDMNANEFFISEQELQEVEPYKSWLSRYYSQKVYNQSNNSYNANQISKAMNKVKRINNKNKTRRF